MTHNRDNVSTALTLFASMALAYAAHAGASDDLEPCINGEVSATGLYVSQAQEDRAQQIAVVQNEGTVDDLYLEPCINGEVSASGLYISQAVEDKTTQAQYAHVTN